MQSTERWVPVSGYEGQYEVSDYGNVRSVDRVDSAARRLKGRVLSRSIRARYLSVTLSSGGAHGYFYVHRLVASAFLSEPELGFEVCHIDGDRFNNHVSNLRWDSHQENQRDMVRHGTHLNARKTHCKRGHLFGGANLIPSDVKAGRRGCLACSRAHGVARRRGVAVDDVTADEKYREIMGDSL